MVFGGHSSTRLLITFHVDLNTSPQKDYFWIVWLMNCQQIIVFFTQFNAYRTRSLGLEDDRPPPTNVSLITEFCLDLSSLKRGMVMRNDISYVLWQIKYGWNSVFPLCRLSSPHPIPKIMALLSTLAEYPYHSLVFTFLICTTLKTVFTRKRRNPNGLPLPPGPKGLPIIGNLLDVPQDKPWLGYNDWCKVYGKRGSLHFST